MNKLYTTIRATKGLLKLQLSREKHGRHLKLVQNKKNIKTSTTTS